MGKFESLSDEKTVSFSFARMRRSGAWAPGTIFDGALPLENVARS
jgi:hypothetical protein